MCYLLGHAGYRHDFPALHVCDFRYAGGTETHENPPRRKATRKHLVGISGGLPSVVQRRLLSGTAMRLKTLPVNTLHASQGHVH